MLQMLNCKKAMDHIICLIHHQIATSHDMAIYSMSLYIVNYSCQNKSETLKTKWNCVSTCQTINNNKRSLIQTNQSLSSENLKKFKSYRVNMVVRLQKILTKVLESPKNVAYSFFFFNYGCICVLMVYFDLVMITRTLPCC